MKTLRRDLTTSLIRSSFLLRRARAETVNNALSAERARGTPEYSTVSINGHIALVRWV
ncbi:MAG: hypothetical protein K0M67_06390 [Thiobacillus sp.]|nr:hypothetical protein [Thiobacillus sp.]